MRVFHCDHCHQLVFFESTQCVKCGRRLAYLPDLQFIGSLDGDNTDSAGVWRSPLPQANGRNYRLCTNYAQAQVCNWAIPENDPNALCIACRLTPTLPDMNVPGRKEAWYRMEGAKRRLIYNLTRLNLPLKNKQDDAERGLIFTYVTDDPVTGETALTGHLAGTITINLAEADDAERERRRCALREPYRTLLSHFRHESGHYYWDQLVRDNAGNLESFRSLFGDERSDYAAALRRNYDEGPPAQWQQTFISAYASSHPWEDWAESWAHYLHMIDTLETAAVCGVSLQPARDDEPALPRMSEAAPYAIEFSELMGSWFAVTYMINNFSRGLGQADAYPFVLADSAIEKLRFIDQLIRAHSANKTISQSMTLG
jgi:hypothetical protein